MTRPRPKVSLLALLVVVVFVGSAHSTTGTATWPGARLDKALLIAYDFPPGVQYGRINRSPGQPDGADGPPAMLSSPEGCADGFTRVFADSAERGPGGAAEYVVG